MFKDQFSRRHFLALTSALTMAPLFTKQAYANEVDVIIVGAGIAGMTAANELNAKGKTVQILEARPRIGGRAWTESETFGVPYDHGCAWLHSADENPLTDMVHNAGFETVDDDEVEKWLTIDGEDAEDGDYDRLDRAIQSIEDDMEYFFEEGPATDRSLSDLQRANNKFRIMAHTIYGPFEAGSEAKDLSIRDVYSQIGTGVEYMVPGGFGAALHKAIGVPAHIALNTIVEKIQWGGADISVTTNQGTLKAKAILITVPPAVIAAGGIQFDPALPDWKLEAIENLPVGALEKTALQFSDNVFGEANRNTLYSWREDTQSVQDHLLRPFDLNLSVTFTGGDISSMLSSSADPTKAAIDRAMEDLEYTFGSSISQNFVKGHYTDWLGDPFALGAYSIAKVGKHSSRKKMKENVDNRLFFAGEATSVTWATQATGAWETGREAAEDIVDALG